MPFYTDRPYPSAGPSILISEIKSNFDQVIIHSGLFQNPSLLWQVNTIICPRQALESHVSAVRSLSSS